MLKIGIIGYGTIAPIHKHAIEQVPDVELTCICDIDITKRLPDIGFYTDIDEMLQREELDAVHICLPHYLHVPMVKKCAEKGLDIFVEKPLGITYEDASSLFGLEETYGVKIGVSLQNRYNITSVRLKEIVEQQTYGKILGSKGLVTWCRKNEYYKDAPWRGKLAQAGGGVMLNQSIHTLDLLQYIGGTFKNVEAKVSNFTLKEQEIEDSVMAHLEYVDSDASSLFIATNSYCINSSVEVEFVFEHAIFRIKDSKLYKICEEFNTQELICEDDTLPGSKSYYGVNHTAAIKDFYNGSYVSLQEGAAPLKLIDGIMESSRTNERIELCTK